MLTTTPNLTSALGNLNGELAGFAAVLGVCLVYALLLYVAALRR
jgi:hypothetical protein